MSDLRDLNGRLARQRIAIIGDVMLDHFLFGRVDRMSPEAPVPIVRFTRDEYRLGGAANVAHNVAAVGAQAALVGLVGADDAAKQVSSALLAIGVDAAGLVVDRTRPTTRKVRIVTSRNQQVARVDYEEDNEPDAATLAALCGRIASAAEGAGAVILSDYRKGVVGPVVLAAAVAATARAGIPLLVDPKVPQAERYRGATVVTPNHHEAEMMTGTRIRTPDDAREAARAVHARCGASVVITWGEQGMWILDASGARLSEAALPAAAREVSDVTGAGDTVIALLALALAAGGTLSEAARLANLGAGLVVARFGPAVVSLEEMTAALGRVAG
jgi:rfaE bifunctional protein kinase chain/domain